VLRNPLITTYLKMGQGARTKTISFRFVREAAQKVRRFHDLEAAKKSNETIPARQQDLPFRGKRATKSWC
jgi:hypothetical protein